MLASTNVHAAKHLIEHNFGTTVRHARSGEVPLTLAAQHGHSETCNWLIKQGALAGFETLFSVTTPGMLRSTSVSEWLQDVHVFAKLVESTQRHRTNIIGTHVAAEILGWFSSRFTDRVLSLALGSADGDAMLRMASEVCLTNHKLPAVSIAVWTPAIRNRLTEKVRLFIESGTFNDGNNIKPSMRPDWVCNCSNCPGNVHAPVLNQRNRKCVNPSKHHRVVAFLAGTASALVYGVRCWNRHITVPPCYWITQLLVQSQCQMSLAVPLLTDVTNIGLLGLHVLPVANYELYHTPHCMD
jgi:hypothetical protein